MEGAFGRVYVLTPFDLPCFIFSFDKDQISFFIHSVLLTESKCPPTLVSHKLHNLTIISVFVIGNRQSLKL